MPLKKKMTGRQRCFTRRDQWLVRLGFETYSNYLKSDVWKNIRNTVLEKRKYVCFFCGGKANQVHHLRYSRNVLLAENKYYLGGLVATCGKCHQSISDYAKENKVHEHHAFCLFCNYRNRRYSLFKGDLSDSSPHPWQRKATLNKTEGEVRPIGHL